jgi:hypothetical protein
MVSLEAEVAAKQAQLSALTAEKAALNAKARALDQLLASAGDGVLCFLFVFVLLMVGAVRMHMCMHWTNCLPQQVMWCFAVFAFVCVGVAQGGWDVGACVCTGPAAGLSRCVARGPLLHVCLLMSWLPSNQASITPSVSTRP